MSMTPILKNGATETPMTEENFWPVFVISLTDATERRTKITAQLSALSIPFEFIDAIDGRKVLPENYEASIDRVETKRQLGRPMSDAEYACALSHMAVYKRIIAENIAGAIVLEDDAIVGQQFAAFRAKRCYDVGALVQMDHVYAYIWKGTKTEMLLARLCTFLVKSKSRRCPRLR